MPNLHGNIKTKMAAIVNKAYLVVVLTIKYEMAPLCGKLKQNLQDKINRSQMSKVVYKASSWDCQDFYIGKTKRRLHDRKTEHFKGITSACHASAIADHVTSTGHNLKWDHFEILAKGRPDTHCKIKETLLIQELKPTLNDNVSSEKLYLY